MGWATLLKLLPSLIKWGLPGVLVIGILAAWHVQGLRVTAANVRADREVLRADAAESKLANFQATIQRASDDMAAQARRAEAEAMDAQETIKKLAERLKDPVAVKTVLEQRVQFVTGVCSPEAPARGGGVPAPADGNDPAELITAATAQARIDAVWSRADALIETIQTLAGKPIILELEK